MSTPSRIISFDEARRNTRAIPRSTRMRMDAAPARNKAADEAHLSNVFKLDFQDEADPSDMTVSFDASPRQAIFSGDDLEDEASAESAGSGGVFSKLKEARRQKSKDKAERAFQRAYGGDGAPSSAGPRAALYTGDLGSAQKKAGRLQESSQAGMPFAMPSFLQAVKLPKLSHRMKRNTAAIAFTLIAVMLAGSIYTPAQQYYQQVRERDRLAAEYTAVQERNDSLQAMVDRLSTDEGLEDKAHAEFGYVKPDERSASVIGMEADTSLDFKANVAPGSVPAPETWYSKVLDLFFLYDRG